MQSFLAEVAEAPLKVLWSGISLVGVRTVAKLLPSQYHGTAICFDRSMV